LEDFDLENNQLKKRYGLFTAICMVVGIVIGSGVFFKAQDILNYTGGNMLLGILAWIIGGIVMIICAFNFANFATKYLKVNGIVDYAEAIVGKKYAYMTGWFLSTIYYPAMTSVLAWVSARYTLVLFDADADITSGLCMALGAFYLCLTYAINILSPKIAGKFQVSATIIKLIPLAIIVVIGTVVGLINGNTIEAFTQASEATGSDFSSVFAGIAAAAFAYEGWIIATSINAELKNAKRNLPIALVVGTLIIMVIYITYFIGLTGGASVDVLREEGSTTAIRNLFGNIGGTILNAFIVISCLGTLNGLMLACTRSLYSLSVRDCGPAPKTFAELDPHTNMPSNSGVFALLCCGAWFFYFYAANLTAPVFGLFSFDSSELPIITIYAIYIPIFVMFIKKEGKNNVFKNIVMPILALIASVFMVFVAVYAHGVRPYLAAAENGEFVFPVLFYLIVFAVIMVIGAFLYQKKNKK
jgi:APA family basic amino acid/polyamine antiporter